jgi:putative transposase
VVDEYTRECLAISVARRIRSHEVLMTLSDLFLQYGIPEHIRSEDGPEFVARAVGEWLSVLGVTSRLIEPAQPWDNG